MRTTPLIALAGCLGFPVAATELAELIALAEQRRDATVQEVRSVREYSVSNARWKTDATMTVEMITGPDGRKRYEVIRTNAEGMRRTILNRILEGEVQAAAKRDRDGNMNAKNYELRPIPASPGDSTCRKVELVARSRTRFTFDGHGCVDMNDMAMVRMEGKTARSLSFLVGRAYVKQEFKKVDGLWYSSLNQSTADVMFLGRTSLTIRYLDYTIVRKPAVVAGGK